MDLDKKQMLTAYLLLVGATLMWSAHAIVGKLAVGTLSPLTLVTLRWAFVAPFVTLITWHKLKQHKSLIPSIVPFALGMGTVGFTCFNGLFYMAAHTTSAINIGITQGSVPVFVLIISRLLFKHPLHAASVIGILITLGGVILVASGGSWQQLTTLNIALGDGLMILACLCYALYTNGLFKRPAMDGLTFFGIAAWGGLISSLPFMAYEAVTDQMLLPDSQSDWLLLGFIALMPSFLAQLFFLKGVDALGPSRAGIFLNLVPIFAAMMAVTFLNEALYTYHIIALILVMSGIYLAEYRHHR